MKSRNFFSSCNNHENECISIIDRYYNYKQLKQIYTKFRYQRLKYNVSFILLNIIRVYMRVSGFTYSVIYFLYLLILFHNGYSLLQVLMLHRFLIFAVNIKVFIYILMYEGIIIICFILDLFQIFVYNNIRFSSWNTITLHFRFIIIYCF